MTATDPTPTVRNAEFVYEVLFTDTRVYEVIARTPKTITVRSTRETGNRRTDESCDKGAYGLSVVWVEQEPDPDGFVCTVRERKDGTYRVGSNPLRPVLGTPERRVDYRY
jgi:hypothetical protein